MRSSLRGSRIKTAAQDTAGIGNARQRRAERTCSKTQTAEACSTVAAVDLMTGGGVPGLSPPCNDDTKGLSKTRVRAAIVLGERD